MSVSTQLDLGAVLGVLGLAGSAVSAWYTHRVYEVTNAHALLDRIENGHHDLMRYFRAVVSTGNTLGVLLAANEKIEVELVDTEVGPVVAPVHVPGPEQKDYPDIPLLARDHELFKFLDEAARFTHRYYKETQRLYEVASTESPNLSSADGHRLISWEREAREKLRALREAIISSRSTERVFRRRRIG